MKKGAGNPKPYDGKGEFQPLSAMILMSVLYAARIARYDLFKPIQFLAKRITKWDERCDLRLHQLMSYINDTLDIHAFGFIGDQPKDLTLHLYVDADFAGCPYTLRSTSGAHTCVQGPNSRFSWGAGSNRRRVAHSPLPRRNWLR